MKILLERYATSEFSTSSNLLRHLKDSHKEIYAEYEKINNHKKSTQSTLRIQGGQVLVVPPAELPQFPDAIALLSAVSYAPLTSVVSHDRFNMYTLAFKAISNDVNLKVPDYRTVRNRQEDMLTEVMNTCYSKFEGLFSFNAFQLITLSLYRLRWFCMSYGRMEQCMQIFLYGYQH